MRNYWAKVLFCEFIRHYRKMDDAEIVADVKQSMDDLEALLPCGKSFGAKMVRWSNERIEFNRETRGKKGGRPKKSTQDAPHGNAVDDVHYAGNGAALKTPTSCEQLKADVYTREGSLDMHLAREGGTLEHATSADIFALDGLAGKDRRERAPQDLDGVPGARVPDVPDSEDLYEHVAAEGLDEFDARQWFEMCCDRGWKDRYGNPIGNWKGALKRFCDAKARSRGKEKEG